MSKITVAIAGLGSRGLQTYAKCLEKFADRAEIVAVADIRTTSLRISALTAWKACSSSPSWRICC